MVWKKVSELEVTKDAKLIVTDVLPRFSYVDGKKTNTQVGYYVEVLIYVIPYDKIRIKMDVDIPPEIGDVISLVGVDFKAEVRYSLSALGFEFLEKE